ncbi:hypothetical protein APHNP_1456 [Anaplasma phagocytophilum str. ApNP]|uniref:Uncharacterized protein n=1 Tax=Anaplasma phagocytophilum str. ApNP TaxID=1359153 RepID=A0A0F3NFQ3_ANAPH|nr:hypothetical protein APHNP_1456 [Anaplasma phagocytophilum str. ApNP]
MDTQGKEIVQVLLKFLIPMLQCRFIFKSISVVSRVGILLQEW